VLGLLLSTIICDLDLNKSYRCVQEHNVFKICPHYSIDHIFFFVSFICFWFRDKVLASNEYEDGLELLIVFLPWPPTSTTMTRYYLLLLLLLLHCPLLPLPTSFNGRISASLFRRELEYRVGERQEGIWVRWAAVEWGPDGSCVFLSESCPPNAHIELCACPASCESPKPSCQPPCIPGCVCNPGFLFSNNQCINESSCNCPYNNKYYKVSLQGCPASQRRIDARTSGSWCSLCERSLESLKGQDQRTGHAVVESFI
jgi:hypothetical protein